MLDEKKCKGQAKAHGWSKACGKKVLANTRKYGLCRSCFKLWATSTKEGDQFIKKMAIKAKVHVERKTKKEEREKKLSEVDYGSRLQERINEIVRLLDRGMCCMARRVHSENMHAGHIFSRGAESSMRYNLHNIHRQSAKSNWYSNEDGELRDGLKGEYGEAYYEFLSEMRRMPTLKYTNEDYRVFNSIANKIAREIRLEGKRYTAKERIEMRNTINLRLGIYAEEYCLFM